MGTENPSRPNSPPFASAPPTITPFSTSRPMVRSDAPGFRPTSYTPPTTTSSMFYGPPVGSQTSGLRPTVPPRFNDPSVLSVPTSNVLPSAGASLCFPTPQFPSGPQPLLDRASPVAQPPFQPPASQLPSVPSFRSQAQVPSVPMGSPPSSMNVTQSSSDLSFVPRPNFQSSFPAAGATLNSPLPGYMKHSSAVSQPPPMQSPFQFQQGNYAPSVPAPSPPFLSHQGSYVQPPPVANPFGLHSRDQMQHPASMTPVGGIQGLAEDFSSLSIGSVPGTMDFGLDAKALPRPLDRDVEPNSLGDAFSMNCDPRYLRLTTSAIPNSHSLLSRWHLPLGAVVCPLAQPPDGEEVPVLNFVSTGIIRCRRCRTYVNPFITFTDAGRKWRCNICSLLNDVPGEYFAHLDATGRRIDLDQRPELKKGSVEFVAPTEYMVRPPMPPLYFFLIDVSILAVQSGMIEIVAQTIKSCLDDLPGFPRTQIGFITYDSTIHFYNMKSSLTQPQMMVVSDLDDIFIPLPDDLLVNLSESRNVVEAFLDSLPSMFQHSMNLESAFGSALKAAFMVMSQLGGKLLIFQNTMPSLGVGRLKLRGDDTRVHGTDKEHALRIPEDPFYKQMAADFTKYQIGVNVYAFSDKYTDIASLGM
uniref:Protein transport protein Sec24-like At3g07100 n=1 Tax=Rhizophora mucronata TaxID=61149 RepID=A0A2P2ISP6_RHIMU